MIEVVIQDTETGEVRVHKDKYLDAKDERSWFIWLEGDYSCDCNRHLFFARAGGDEDPEDLPCGEGRFRVLSPSFLAGDVSESGDAE